MNNNFKKIGIILFIFIVIFIFVFLFLNKDKKQVEDLTPSQTQTEQPLDQEAGLAEQRAQDVSYFDSSIDYENNNVDPSQCDGISDDYTKDLCYDRVAVFASDLAVCDNIIDESTRQICYLKIYKDLAAEAKDPALCRELPTQGLVDNCIKSIVKTNFCLSDEECYQNFLDNQDNYDADQDGLTDLEEEWIYQTDPNNSDTDGDGYLDGEEVSGGYNPLGPGKIE